MHIIYVSVKERERERERERRKIRELVERGGDRERGRGGKRSIVDVNRK